MARKAPRTCSEFRIGDEVMPIAYPELHKGLTSTVVVVGRKWVTVELLQHNTGARWRKKMLPEWLVRVEAKP